MTLEALKNDITIYLNILYECKYMANIYKKLKINSDSINRYSYPFIVILNSLILSLCVKLNSIISNDNQKNIKKLLINCESNKKNVDSRKFQNIKNNIENLMIKNVNVLDNLKTWRDKNMAHSDSKYFGKIDYLLQEHSIINDDLINFVNLLSESLKDLYELFSCNGGAYDCSKEIDIDLEELFIDIRKKALYK